MLGERIRKLRKQKKLTLEALAGDVLTKGMLSLIENNKAQPSMESLSYIAKRLEVDTADLLEEISSAELMEILEQAENIYSSDFEKSPNKYIELVSLIKPFINNLTQGYASARLLDIYSRSLYRSKKSGWEEIADRAYFLYEQLNLASYQADISIFRSSEKFITHEYEESLTLFLHERAKLESKQAYMNQMTRLDLDYHEAILYFAVGDSKSAIQVMEKAIDFSKEKRLFYRIDDLYRLAAAEALMSHNKEKRDYYTKKLKQYGEFADDRHSIVFHELLQIMTIIAEEQNYHYALQLINQYNLESEDMCNFKVWFYLEKGKALYGLGHFKEALLYLKKVEIPENFHHPFDLSIFYVTDSYKALCYVELQKIDLALESAKIAVEKISPLPHTPYKEMIYDTYEKIKGKASKTNEAEES
ncbi:helix-turn-helix domain-containing protein [Heyndrickxia vini]|uniref:Helix-turn-helix transcriptional regulator n=1 Tax=Heyndrickxia vini TaxID=1476025 RepID=A0ABX7DZR3_9BACI|nr:helix-turn-helix transcriptional regulator [Heyndrickxia vini]QQZ08958.1 helix-turn-helix transcriptional regulator [Heyndrickxia vini]